MPKKRSRKIYNFNLSSRRKISSHENIDENPPYQVSIQETPPSPQPTRAAKERCLKNISKIITEERCDTRRQLLARESVEQRAQRLEDLRQRALQRQASETVEQRAQRLEKQRRRASQRIAGETVEQRAQRLELQRRRDSQRRASETVELREQRLKIKRRRASQRLASETDEQRQQRLERQRRLRRASQRVTSKQKRKMEEEKKDDMHIDFESVWNYQNLKKEEKELESAEEEKLVKDEEMEIKPPLFILVQPNYDLDNNKDKCEERNIFQEDDGIAKVSDLNMKQEKESTAGDLNFLLQYEDICV